MAEMMIVLLLLVANAGIAFFPGRIGFLGRVLAGLNFFDLLFCLVNLLDWDEPEGLGALNHLINPDVKSSRAEIVVGVMITLVALVGAFRHRESAANIKFNLASIKISPVFAYSLLAACLVAGVITIISVGPATLYSYQGYGTIKAGAGDGAMSVAMRFIGTVFRAFSLLLLGVTILFARGGRSHFAILAAIPITLAIAVGLAEASRIVAVYGAVAAINFFLSRKKVAGIVTGLLSVLIVVYCLEARSHDRLGLSYLPAYTADAVKSQGPILSALANISNQLLIVNASSHAASPEQYGVGYKIISFLPSVNFIDNFQSYRDSDEQRILPYIPFSSFAESYLFGGMYFIFFWLVILYSVECVNALSRYSSVSMLLAIALFLVGWLFAGQYPVRNSVRFFYVLIIFRHVMFYRHRHRGGRLVKKVFKPLVHDRVQVRGQ